MIPYEDDRIRFDVDTPHGRDDIQVMMPNGSMEVLTYEQAGLSKRDIEYEGVASLLHPMIGEAKHEMEKAQHDVYEIQGQRENLFHQTAQHRQDLTQQLQVLEDQIAKAQYVLDDVVSASVWPDYIPKDPSVAYDPAAAAVHNEHMWEAYTYEERKRHERLIAELQQHYEVREALRREVDFTLQTDPGTDTFDYRGGRKRTFDDALYEANRRADEAQKRLMWLTDLVAKDYERIQKKKIEAAEGTVKVLGALKKVPEDAMVKLRKVLDESLEPNVSDDTPLWVEGDPRAGDPQYLQTAQQAYQKISKIEDEIYQLEAYLESITDERLWNDLGSLNTPEETSVPDLAAEFLKSVKEWDEQSRRETLSASAKLGAYYDTKKQTIKMLEGAAKIEKQFREKLDSAQEAATEAAEESFQADQRLSNVDRYLRQRDSWNTGQRIKLSKSIIGDIQNRNPLKTAAAKLTAMGQNLYEAPVKLRLSNDPVKSTHFKEMLALRAGYKLEGRGLKVNVLERPNENGNKCLCEIVGTDVITQLTIEVDAKQHYKLIASTCMNEDPMWTEAENDTPGVPPNLSTFERPKPKNLNQYIHYHSLIAENIRESRAAAE